MLYVVITGQPRAQQWIGSRGEAEDRGGALLPGRQRPGLGLGLEHLGLLDQRQDLQRLGREPEGAGGDGDRVV